VLNRFRLPLFLILIGVGLLLLVVYNSYHPEQTGVARKIIMEGATALEYVLREPLKLARDTWQKYVFLVGVVEENRKLKKDVNRLIGQLVQYQEAYEENKRLRNLLKLEEKLQFRHIFARVIGVDRKSMVKSLIINRGSLDGVKRNAPVITDRGLVGRVLETSWHISRVLLLIDETSNVDVIVQSSRVQGMLQGTGHGCSIKYVGKMDEVKMGDAVITAGISRVFPKGLLIGYISHVDWREGGMFKKVEINPAVDFSRLEEVVVLIPPGDQE